MAIEVIGAGFGRTSTMSLKVTLEELGFGPCYRVIELFGHPERILTEKLLVYEVKEDWRPLCEFLGVEGLGGINVPLETHPALSHYPMQLLARR